MCYSNLLAVDTPGAVGGTPSTPHSYSGDGCADKRELEQVENRADHLNVGNFLQTLGLDQLIVRTILPLFVSLKSIACPQSPKNSPVMTRLELSPRLQSTSPVPSQTCPQELVPRTLVNPAIS